MGTRTDKPDLDDWAAALRAATALDAAATAPPAEPEPCPPLDLADPDLGAPWQTIDIGTSSIVVQMVDSHHARGRRLVVVEFDGGDPESERRVEAALQVLTGAG